MKAFFSTLLSVTMLLLTGCGGGGGDGGTLSNPVNVNPNISAFMDSRIDVKSFDASVVSNKTRVSVEKIDSRGEYSDKNSYIVDIDGLYTDTKDAALLQKVKDKISETNLNASLKYKALKVRGMSASSVGQIKTEVDVEAFYELNSSVQKIEVYSGFKFQEFFNGVNDQNLLSKVEPIVSLFDPSRFLKYNGFSITYKSTGSVLWENSIGYTNVEVCLQYVYLDLYTKCTLKRLNFAGIIIDPQLDAVILNKLNSLGLTK